MCVCVCMCVCVPAEHQHHCRNTYGRTLLQCKGKVRLSAGITWNQNCGVFVIMYVFSGILPSITSTFLILLVMEMVVGCFIIALLCSRFSHMQKRAVPTMLCSLERRLQVRG